MSRLVRGSTPVLYDGTAVPFSLKRAPGQIPLVSGPSSPRFDFGDSGCVYLTGLGTRFEHVPTWDAYFEVPTWVAVTG